MLRKDSPDNFQVRILDSGSPVTGLVPSDFRVYLTDPSGDTNLKYPSDVSESDPFRAPGVYTIGLDASDLDTEGGLGLLVRPRSSWVPSTIDNVSPLESVDFATSNDGFAVGRDGTVLSTTDGGSTWTSETSGVTDDLFSVDATSNVDAWAAGADQTLLRRDTNGWSTLHQTAPDGWTDLVVDGPSDVVITEDTGRVVRWDGSSPVELDDGSTASSALSAVAKPDSQTYVAVGDDGTVIRTTDDGTTWSAPSTPVSEDLSDVAFADATTGWAFGYDGTVLSTTDGGSTWSAQSTPVDLDLLDAAVHSTSDVWAVGAEGVLLETSDGGSTWNRRSTSQSTPLRGSWAFSATDALFVGGDPDAVVVEGMIPAPSFDPVFESLSVGDTLDAKLDRLLGLSQENYRITDQVYDENDNLEEAWITTYPTASDTVNQTNPTAEYRLKAFYDESDRLRDYRVTRQ